MQSNSPRLAGIQSLIPRWVPLFSICLLFASSPAAAQTWTQVWGDDFNGAAGSAPNSANWMYDTGNNWGNGEIDYGTNSTQNGYLDGNGDLVIALLYSASGFCQYPGCPNYTSAHLQTAGLFAAGPYGRIETRLKVPDTPGVGAAFWSLGNDYYSQGTPWPWSGELDMVEIPYPNIGQNGSTVHGGETDSQTNFEYNGLSRQVFLPSGQLFSQAFHIFGTNWMPYRFTFDLDGTTYGQTDLQNLGATDIWAFQQPIYLILSAGVGASNSGTPVPADFPTYFTIDYVHVFKDAAGAPAPPTGLTATGTTSNSTTLNWSASTTSDALYDVYVSNTAGFTPNLNTLVADNVSGTTFMHTGLAANTTYYYKVVSSDFGGESSAATVTVTTEPLGNSPALYINAGGYTIGNWMADTQYVLGGNTNYHPNVTIDTSAVANPAPQGVYQVERWGAAAWTITNLNPGGSYEVQLQFVELTHTGSGQRAFNVSLNGQTLLSNFDIYANAGAANKVVVETFYTKADEYGIIELQTNFGTSTASDLNPTIEAIAITQGGGSPFSGASGGSTSSLSINSGGPAVSPFVADEDYNGGDTAGPVTNTINTSAVNAAPQAVYQTQRYVPFTYVITGLVPDATYTVRMHFAETYWTAAGKRIFNVNLNGSRVLANFDVYATAGANTALVEQFSTHADMYGQIIVQLIAGSADQPFIDGLQAIEAAGAIGAPSNLAAKAGSGSISLSWTASTTSGVAYTVYRNVAGSAPAAIASGVTGTSYVDSSSLTSGTTYYYTVVATKSGATSFNSNTASATAGSGGGGSSAISIDCGGAASGSWAADEDFSGGSTYSVTAAISTSLVTNPAPQAVYQTARQGTFTYTIPGFTAGSSHTVTLQFAELYWTAAGKREFDASINGTTVLTNFDIFASAGDARYAAVAKSFTATANSSGQIVIQFSDGAVDQPMINGISVQ
jgi:trimeric autotransporter adhesin